VLVGQGDSAQGGCTGRAVTDRTVALVVRPRSSRTFPLSP
jgi:hypothetical protein